MIGYLRVVYLHRARRVFLPGKETKASATDPQVRRSAGDESRREKGGTVEP